MSLVDRGPLNGQTRSISRDQMIVRFTNDQRLILSLSELSEVREDTYRGSVRLATVAGRAYEVPVVAVCKASLWWGGS